MLFVMVFGLGCFFVVGNGLNRWRERKDEFFFVDVLIFVLL